MNLVRRFLRTIDSINDSLGKTISYLIVVITVLLVYEVVRRYAFNAPTTWVGELSLLIFGAYGILAGSYAFLHGRHVNVDILYRRWSPRTRAIVDLITAVLLFYFCSLLLWKGGEEAWRSLQMLERSNSFWKPPIYPVRLMIPVAAFLLLLQGIAKFIRDLTTAVTGRGEE